MYCLQIGLQILQQYCEYYNYNTQKMIEEPIKGSTRIFNLINPQQTKLQSVKILIIGVGGIGCQILKVLCKMPIGQVHVIDMDTIELSNLNRQFLFKKEHRGMSKSLVAKETTMKLNPDFKIQAHHKNIKELPIAFFKQFSYLVMALDNIQARNYVNKVGVRLNIPIIDAGTMGYKGNVATIIPQATRCYSCQPKQSNQKQFPVCTIRMRPEKPIHCIVWGKLLFEVLFGPQNQDNDLKDLAQLAQSKGVKEIMTKLFETDILEIKNAKEDSESKLSQLFAKSIKVLSKEDIQNHTQQRLLQGGKFNKHEQKLTVAQNIAIFSQAFERLIKQKQQEGIITFEKDDDNIIHFISSGANLRMHCFNIEEISFNEIKNITGNIVPAIASTNSIVSGIEVSQMLKHLNNQSDKMKSYFIQNLNTKILGLKPQKSFPTCQVCNDSAIPVTIQVNMTKFKLVDLVKIINEKSAWLTQYSINNGPTQLYNSDEPNEKLMQKAIFQISQSFEVDLVVTNQNTMKKVCVVWIIHNAQLKDDQVTITNYQQFKQRIQEETSEPVNQNAKPNDQQANNDNDSDMVMFDDDNQNDLQIVQVKKIDKSIQASNNRTQSKNDESNQKELKEKSISIENKEKLQTVNINAEPDLKINDSIVVQNGNQPQKDKEVQKNQNGHIVAENGHSEKIHTEEENGKEQLQDHKPANGIKHNPEAEKRSASEFKIQLEDSDSIKKKVKENQV